MHVCVLFVRRRQKAIMTWIRDSGNVQRTSTGARRGGTDGETSLGAVRGSGEKRRGCGRGGQQDVRCGKS